MPNKKPNGLPGRLSGDLKITLIRSLIGLKPNHVRTLRALGLRKIRGTVWHADTPAILGMLARVRYAVRVEPARDGGRHEPR